MDGRERYFARQRRYNASAKDRERWVTYWHRRGTKLRTAQRIERDDPEFAAYLHGEITCEEMTPLPKVRPL